MERTVKEAVLKDMESCPDDFEPEQIEAVKAWLDHPDNQQYLNQEYKDYEQVDLVYTVVKY